MVVTALPPIIRITHYINKQSSVIKKGDIIIQAKSASSFFFFMYPITTRFKAANIFLILRITLWRFITVQKGSDLDRALMILVIQHNYLNLDRGQRQCPLTIRNLREMVDTFCTKNLTTF